MTQHHSYLLRLWREHDSVAHLAGPLRVVLIDPTTGEQRSFTSLIALAAFLEMTTQDDTNDLQRRLT